MKKSLVVFFVLVIAALSVMAVSADQDGNHTYCNVDSYGCWVTGENGAHEYILFWSEAARDFIMGPGSNAPLGLALGFTGRVDLNTTAAADVEDEDTASSDTDKTDESKDEDSKTGGGSDSSGGDSSGGDSSGGEGTDGGSSECDGTGCGTGGTTSDDSDDGSGGRQRR